MVIWELLITAIGLSMDAFAVAACSGLTMPKVTVKKMLVVGLYFGIFQAIMPLIGYLLANQFADKIESLDHWITFILLSIIGTKMAIDSFKDDYENTISDTKSFLQGEKPVKTEISLTPAKMLPLAVATSIDALAVGVSFAFLHVNIVTAVLLIGVITLTLSIIGVKIGNLFGTKFKSKAEFFGGIILIFMGVKILLEHLGFFEYLMKM